MSTPRPGQGESTTDLSWDGQTSIDENGVRLAEGARFSADPVTTLADIDLDLIAQERLSSGSFDDNARERGRAYRAHRFPARSTGGRPRPAATRRALPFVPADPARLAQDCYEAYNIQVAGLAQRLEATGTKKLVIGVSGGLDSTHALIVAAKAFDRLGLPRRSILAYTLPGFATSDETKANAHALMAALGVTANEIDIRPTAKQMLEEMGHPFGRGEAVYDVTFENVQAGLRTDYLFRLANHHGGIVLGTGDLSELALGLEHLRRRRPDEPLRRQRRRPEDADPAPDPLGGRLGAVRRAREQDVPRRARHRDLARTGAGRGRRGASEHRGHDRPLRAAGLQSLLHAAPRLPALEDRLPGASRLGRS